MRGILKVSALEILKKTHNLKSMENSLENTREGTQSSTLYTERDSDPCQTSKMEPLVINDFQLLFHPSINFANYPS